MVAMFYPWENLALGRSVALQFVGDNHPRHIGQPLEELAEELLRGPFIPPTLDQDIQDVAVLIDRPPEIMMLATNRDEHRIAMSRVSKTPLGVAVLLSLRGSGEHNP
jgi:hypothetical protein